MKVRANATYYYNTCGWELCAPTANSHLFTKGDKVRVVNLHGCPPANTMGQCYIVPADAVKDDRGRWNKEFAMVSTNSLQKEPTTICPACQKAKELKFPHPTPTHCSAECYLTSKATATV